MKNRKSVYIIAEAGVNHNGDFQMATLLIKEAVKAKVDAIKFQTFITEDCISHSANLAAYQRDNLKASSEINQIKMIKPLEFSFQQFLDLYEICLKSEIQFLSTAFDMASITFLSSLNLPFWKIPSGEITNLPYLLKIGSFNKNILLSTGMADIGEIEDAINLLEIAGTSREKITVLHCNTEYPTPMQDVNLKSMQTIQHAFPGVFVGYSDHTEGIETSIAAVALGATVIEKHFTLDTRLPGPDHKASIEPEQLSQLVSSIRNIEAAMGNGIKRPSPSEIKNIPIARKSIVALKAINKGEYFTGENLTVKRPGSGVSPMRWNEVIGKIAQRDYLEDELIDA